MLITSIIVSKIDSCDVILHLNRKIQRAFISRDIWFLSFELKIQRKKNDFEKNCFQLI